MDVLADTVARSTRIWSSRRRSITIFNPRRTRLTEELAKGRKIRVSQGAVWRSIPMARFARCRRRDYGESQFNRAVAAKRQPGPPSSLRLSRGLEHGLTPTPFAKTGRSTSRLAAGKLQPRIFRPVTLTKALSLSLNTVACASHGGGPKAIVRTAHRLGIKFGLAANASLALGTSR